MSNIIFYNLAHSDKTGKIVEGTKLSILELISENLQIDSIPVQARQLLTSLKMDNIDPIGIERPSRWENLMSAIIYCICGQLPLRQEVLRGRQIMLALPRNLKISPIAEKIAFPLLPYILIGFKTHLEDHFQSDSNTVADVVSFIVRLCNNPNPLALSFLCAHRGKSISEKHILVDSVQTKKAQVALNMIKGILANDPWAKNSSIHWYQQGPTEWACLNMFPEMFLQYLVSGKISHLLNLLEKHFAELNEILSIPDSNQIETRLIELDSITTKVTSFLSKKYGILWRSEDFSNTRTQKDQLISIALDITLPEVIRQMPFYSSPHSGQEYINKKSFYITQNIERSSNSNPIHINLIKNAIERFFQAQIMHPTAKAVYETTFYYLWGKSAALNQKELSIGIDRDHNLFQYVAWKQGFNDELGNNVNIPLLYSRRTAENSEGSALKDYCLRQFWR